MYIWSYDIRLDYPKKKKKVENGSGDDGHHKEALISRSTH